MIDHSSRHDTRTGTSLIQKERRETNPKCHAKRQRLFRDGIFEDDRNACNDSLLIDEPRTFRA